MTISIMQNSTSSTPTTHAWTVNETEEEIQRLLVSAVQTSTIKVMVPAMVMLLLYAVTGAVGNMLVLIVYWKGFKQGATRVLILVIAGLDLFCSLLVVPAEVYDMFHLWDWQDAPLCKARIFISGTVTSASAFALLIVAVVRYRKVIRPFGWQVTSNHARILAVVGLFLALGFCAPLAVVNGRQTKPIPHTFTQAYSNSSSIYYGHECTTDDAYLETIWPTIATGILFLLFILSAVPLVVIYTLIGRKAFKHRKKFAVQRIATRSSSAGTIPLRVFRNIGSMYSKKRSDSPDAPANKAGNSTTATASSSLSEVSGSGNNVDQSEQAVSTINSGQVNSSKQTLLQNSSEPETSVSKASQSDVPLSAGFDCKNKDLSFTELASETADDSNIPINIPIHLKGKDAASISTASSLNAITTKINKYQTAPSGAYNTCYVSTDDEDLSQDLCQGEGSGVKQLDDKDNLDLDPTKLFTASTSPATRFEDVSLNSVATSTDDSTEEIIPSETKDSKPKEPPSDGENDKPTKKKTFSERGKEAKTNSQNSLLKNIVTKSIKDKKKNSVQGSTSVMSKRSDSRKQDRPQVLNRTTVMLLTITAIFIGGYLSHLAMMFFKIGAPETFNAMGPFGMSMWNLFLRLYYINCASNPIVYSLCDLSFRKKFWALFQER